MIKIGVDECKKDEGYHIEILFAFVKFLVRWSCEEGGYSVSTSKMRLCKFIGVNCYYLSLFEFDHLNGSKENYYLVNFVNASVLASLLLWVTAAILRNKIMCKLAPADDLTLNSVLIGFFFLGWIIGPSIWYINHTSYNILIKLIGQESLLLSQHH